MFDILIWSALAAFVVSVGAFVWYALRGRPHGALRVAVPSLIAAPGLLLAAFALFGGGGDPEPTATCDCPEFVQAVTEIAWVPSDARFVGSPVVEGTRANVIMSFDPQSQTALERLIAGLGMLGAETVALPSSSGFVRTPLLGPGRVEVQASWGPDAVRIHVATDVEVLDAIDRELAPIRAVFGTVVDPLPVVIPVSSSSGEGTPRCPPLRSIRA